MLESGDSGVTVARTVLTRRPRASRISATFCGLGALRNSPASRHKYVDLNCDWTIGINELSAAITGETEP
jgi:hypothetical protein